MRISDWSSDVCSSDLFNMVMNQDRLTARAEAVKSARTGLRPPTHRGAVPDGRHGYEPGRQERCEFKIVQLDFGLARYGIVRGPAIQFKFRAYPRGHVHDPPPTPRSDDMSGGKKG